MTKSHKEYVYETCCVECTDRVEALNKMIEGAVEVTYGTMLRHCAGLLEWAKDHNYDARSTQGLTLKNDWHLEYYRSTFDGFPCYYLRWSGIEFIWVKGGRS